MDTINQKEYLKKYLGIGKVPGEKKRKKKLKGVGNRITIIDDDVETTFANSMVEEDPLLASEDAPQIVAIIDERPPSLRVDEKTKNPLWQPIGTTETVATEQKQMITGFKISSKSNDKPFARPVDRSPPRRRKVVDSYSPPRKSKNDEYPPPRKRLDNEDSLSTKYKTEDNSPPIKSSLKRSVIIDDSSPPQKSRDDDYSPPRRSRSENSSPRKSRNDDYSPPRKPKMYTSSPRKPRNDNSPPRKSRSQNSSPRKSRNEDYSPPRKQKNYQISPRNNDKSPPRKSKNDMSPPRRRPVADNDNSQDRIPKSDFSPPRKSRNDVSSPKKIKTRDYSPARKQGTSKLEYKEESRKNKRSDDSQRSGKMEKTLDGKTAGLQNAEQLVEETKQFRNREDQLFKNLSQDVSGENADTVFRDRKSGKIRNLAEEEEWQRKKREEEEKNKEKYSRWGRGLVQVESRDQRIKEELHEMSKPLARYADDEDLERYLKEQEREGDPMLAYIRSKKRKESAKAGVVVKPEFEGQFMPNRFGIKPGHRWDGVDRSNGYEKRWFEVQNAKRAQQEDVYKWSTEDM